jgi:mono/diheme cytochrome c family protein
MAARRIPQRCTITGGSMTICIHSTTPQLSEHRTNRSLPRALFAAGRFALAVCFLLAMIAARASAADVSAGQALFASHCARCHGADGRGAGMITRMLAAVRIAPRPVDFTDAAAMKGWTDEQLATIIREGGKATGRSSMMPEYGDKLTAQDITNLVAYIRSLQK